MFYYLLYISYFPTHPVKEKQEPGSLSSYHKKTGLPVMGNPSKTECRRRQTTTPRRDERCRFAVSGCFVESFDRNVESLNAWFKC